MSAPIDILHGRCYKNTFQNLPIFIADSEAELSGSGRAAPPELLKAKSLETVVQLAGVIDLLRHTKDLSVAMQKVNVLPWEIEESIAISLGRLRELSTDLSQGKIDRTYLIDGKPEPALEYLTLHMSAFKQLKLRRLDKEANVRGEVELVLPTAQRASRGQMGAFLGQGARALHMLYIYLWGGRGGGGARSS